MDVANLAPEIAAALGISPSTMVLLLMIITSAANMGARRIPDDATGALGILRKLCAVVGMHVNTRISNGVTVNDIAKAALTTQPITDTVDAANEDKK